MTDRLPELQRHALEDDASGAFPSRDIAMLRDLGLLGAPVPVALGGLGMGTEPAGALALMEALRVVGRGGLAVGRVLEAHVNALRLVMRYGTNGQVATAAAEALDGQLFGLWVTDAPDAPATLTAEGVLSGAKAPCSAAGQTGGAVITVHNPDARQEQMLLVDIPPGVPVNPTGWDLHGMRAAVSLRVDLNGLHADAAALLGQPGDYLRQPDFSAGAWRTLAVTLGGLEALVAEARAQLVARGRQDDPHQRARIGEALIAQETVRLWVWRAALIGETANADPQDIANTVNLARLAVEAACLDAIRTVQRALGLAAFRRGTLTELLFRDLAVYLRQPAGDIALTEAAGQFMHRDPPAFATAWP